VPQFQVYQASANKNKLVCTELILGIKGAGFSNIDPPGRVAFR